MKTWKLWKLTWSLRFFGLTKIPLLFYVRPRVIRLEPSSCEVMIPLTRRTKNHLGSMYFGALCIGADCAGGALAMLTIRKNKVPVSLSFKDFKAQFLKLAKSDVHFVCRNGDEILRQLETTLKTGERINQTVRVTATTPQISGDEPVALFDLTLSLKA